MDREKISGFTNENIDLLSSAIKNIQEAVYLVDKEGKLHYVNDEASNILGYSNQELLIKNIIDINPSYNMENWINHWNELKEKKSMIFESINVTKNGKLIPVEINANFFSYNGQEYDLRLVRDITLRKENENKNHILIQFLSAMDRINQIIQTTADLEKILDNVLSELIQIFSCDRAFLLYPLDKNTESWSVPNIRFKEEYSVAVTKNKKVSMHSEISDLFKSALNSEKPITVTTENKLIDFPSTLKYPNDDSNIIIPIFPKVGMPWLLCLQQCSKERIWTDEEKHTLELISRRIADALSSLIINNNLRISEEKYRTIIETSKDAILILDIENRPTFLNRKLMNMLGYDESEIIGRSIDEFMFDEEKNDFKEKIDNRRNLNSESFERRFRKNDGSILWTYISASPMLNDAGEYIGSFSMLTDISSRKQAEFELLKLNRIYRTLSECNEALVLAKNEIELLDKICDIIIKTGGYKLAWVGYAQNDKEKSVKLVSNKGNGEDYVSNIKISWAENEYGNGPTGKAIRFKTAQVSHIQTDENFKVWRTPAEQHGYVSTAAFPLTIDDDHTGVISIYSGTNDSFDEEEIKLLTELASDLAYGISNIRARDEIQKLNLTLEQRVKERTGQLEVLNKDLRAFSYTVSHDLRVPLQRITNYLELLKEKLKPGSDKEINEYLKKVVESTHEMDQLVENILKFSSSENKELISTTVNLSNVIQKVIKSFEPEIRNRKVRWHIGTIPNVLGDEILLQLVIVNLISNALKFTKNKKETIITIDSRSTETENIFYINDNGVGFDMKEVDKLFSAFQRLHSSNEFEGTGIGLSSVRRIIERHNGRIWAESRLNQGATFYFSLPKN